MDSLTLRWPAVVTDAADPEVYVVDAVNTGPERWVPARGRAFHVVGTIVPRGTASGAVGWAALAQTPAVPLDPGEYARLPVSIGPGAWRDLEPGAHDVHAFLVGTELRAPVLHVELGADRILERRREGVRPHPARRRRLLDDEIARLTAVLAAGPLLEALVREISGISDEERVVEAIARHLGVEQTAARSILGAPLRDLHVSGSGRPRELIARAVQRRDGGG